MKVTKIKKKRRIKTKELRQEIKKERSRTNKKFVKLDHLDDRLVKETEKIVKTVKKDSEQTDAEIAKLEYVADSMNNFVADMAKGGIRTDFMKENAELIKDVFFNAVEEYKAKNGKDKEDKDGKEAEGEEAAAESKG